MSIDESSTLDEQTVSPQAVAALLEHRAEFLSFLERKVRDRALAEDILQDAFARLDKLASLRDEESAVAWFYRVLRNAVIDQARRAATRANNLTAFAEELSEDPRESPDTEARVCRCVSMLKDTLRPAYREALEQIEVGGMPVKDYAAQQGITPGNAAVRLFRARDALRKQVARSCGACAEHGCVDCTCRH
jgi:RNA polymerase sigma factor (sigma-70 family)